MVLAGKVLNILPRNLATQPAWPSCPAANGTNGPSKLNRREGLTTMIDLIVYTVLAAYFVATVVLTARAGA